jgi:type IV secretion system protein VirD4
MPAIVLPQAPRREIVLWASLAAAAFAVLCTGTMYGAGVLFLAASHRSPAQAGVTSVLDYWAAYHDEPTLGRRLDLSILIAALTCFVGLPAAALAARDRRRPLHGASRFARRSEVAAAGLLAPRGIVVGRLGRHFLRLDGQRFVLLCAPTRSFKGVSVVIPNLLSWPDSVVVNDIKGEAFAVTAGFRAKHGSAVFLWDPFNEQAATHRYNPLGYVRADGHHRVGDLLSIGQVIYPNDGRSLSSEGFFNDQARNLFLALGLYLLETPGLPRTIGELLRQASGDGRPLKEHLNHVIQTREKSPRPLSDECIQALMRFLSNPDNTLGSILSTFNAPLTVFADPIVDAATSANDFDLREVRRRRMSIYVRVAPNKLADARLVLNLFWSQLVNLNTRELPDHDPTLKLPCLLVLDEFPALGHVGVLARGVGYLAGYNLRFLTVAQSLSQLEDIYGERGARALVTNHALQILFAPREQRDANEYSDMLGSYTAEGRSRGRSTSSAPRGDSTSSSLNRSEQRRPLMLPQELKELGVGREIILLENAKPILAGKIVYFEDPVFKSRLLPPPTVKGLDMEAHQARAQRRTREATDADFKDDGGNLLDRLAHNLDDLPPLAADDATPEQIAAYVEAFFGRLELGEADEEAQEEAPGPTELGSITEAEPDRGIEPASRR